MLLGDAGFKGEAGVGFVGSGPHRGVQRIGSSMSNEVMENGVSRRTVLKGAALGGIGLV
ncbi:MAG: hypothetical protein RL540_932, partial [Actinomycetota bacterium]